jgi:hypothetical protein
MLISLSHRFVFVANVKTASTSIESALRPYAEIAISETRFGKHASLAQIQDRFAFIFNKQPIESFFTFGVIRDPVDLLVSVYSSHHKPEFRTEPHYTGNQTFDEFLDSFRRRQSWQIVPQSQRLSDKAGKIRLDYVIDFDRLDAQFADVLALIGLPPTPLPTYNESPDVMSPADVPAATRASIEADYRRDRRVRRVLAGRWLRAPDALPSSAAPAAGRAS